MANWAKFAAMGVKAGPVGMLRFFKKHPWLRYLLRANRLHDMMCSTRSGPYKEANAIVISNIVSGFSDMICDMVRKPETVVHHEDLVPPEILFGMGLSPWMFELLGIVLPLIEPSSMEQYIDMSENEGIPPDLCSLPKSTMGLALSGHIPPAAAAIASNMPCDGGMAQYAMIARETGVPFFMLDVPYDFYSDRAIDYFKGELERMIKWLEQHTPGRMDWDRLKMVCEQKNRFVELEYELWDMLMEKPAPLAAEPVYLGHLMYGIARPGDPRGVRVMESLVSLAAKSRDCGGALSHEEHRVILWNPPTLIFPDLFVWAEQAYGVAMIMDMLTYHRHPFIDTSTPESMLRGLAMTTMQGPMARHTRGPAENFFSDLFHIYDLFSTDMIWMAGHIGCKNTRALLGMFREKCRRRKIPLLVIDYDLSDTRIVPSDDIKMQVEQFMETIMKAERK